MAFKYFYKNLITIFVFLVFVFPAVTNAQVQISGFGGYLLSSDVPVAKGDLKIKDAPNYGLGLDIKVERELKAVIFWTTANTSAELRKFTGETNFITDVSIHHFQGGGMYEPNRGKVRPFFALTVGATLFHPTKKDYSDEWRFSVTLGAGGKVYISDRVGIKLQARVLIPMQFSGAGFWCGTGGCGVGVGTWTQFVEADFTGGLFVQLGK
jgi:hypothetical protein